MAVNLSTLNHKELTKKLQDRLNRLSLDDMEAYIVEVVLSGDREISVPNKLTFIPSKYIVVSQDGVGFVTRGSSKWTKKSLSLKLERLVTEYTLKKTFRDLDINGSAVTILSDVSLVAEESKEVTATVVFLR